jgi:hypothetical protein
MEVCCVYTYEDNKMKPRKNCLKKWGKKRRNGNIMEG